MDKLFDAFNEYVMNFDLNDEGILRKYNHSYRVVSRMENLTMSLKLDEEDKYIASVIALLHDYARFEQWTKYKTYSDIDSIDHADLAIKLLFDDHHIDKMGIDKKYYDIISTSIKYHNKIGYDESKFSEKELLHIKLIRDADKMDIMYIYSTPNIMGLNDTDDEITKEIHDDFFNHKVIDRRKMKNQNDYVVNALSLVFDINFEYSKERIIKEKYLEKTYNNFKNKKLFKEYIDEAKSYLKGKR